MKLLGMYMDKFAQVKLPFPLPSPSVIANNPEQHKNQLMSACMLGITMTLPSAFFGLNETDETLDDRCYPLPIDSSMEISCPTKIAPIVLNICKPLMNLNSNNFSSYDPFDIFSYDMTYSSFSYNYRKGYNSLSYKYGNKDFLQWIGDEENFDELYVENFCVLIVKLSSSTTRECLQPFCVNANENWKRFSSDGETYSPTLVATAKSMAPSIVSSNEPTPLPTSVVSSEKPTISPTLLASSHKPTTLPTMTSQEPTSLPTMTAVPEKSVQVVFQAGITLVGNMTAEEIPREGPELDQMVEVLTVAISDMLPCQSTVQII